MSVVFTYSLSFSDHSRFVKFVMMANGSKYDTNAWNLFKAVIGREEKKKKEEWTKEEEEGDDVTLFDDLLSSETTSEYSISPSNSPQTKKQCVFSHFFSFSCICLNYISIFSYVTHLMLPIGNTRMASLFLLQ
jgi:hypothetical protein